MNTTIPNGFCQCGCGQPVSIAPATDKHKGWIKGQPVRYITGHNRRRPMAERFWEKVDKHGPNECWGWKGTKLKFGHGAFAGTTAHRTAYTLTYGPIPSNAFICHKCNNPGCCNPVHLYPGTQKDNIHDQIEAGTHHYAEPMHGSHHPNAKLTEKQVIELRQKHTSGATPQELSKEYGVTRANVQYIISRKAWTHIP